MHWHNNFEALTLYLFDQGDSSGMVSCGRVNRMYYHTRVDDN